MTDNKLTNWFRACALLLPVSLAVLLPAQQAAADCETVNGVYIFNLFQFRPNSGDFVVAFREDRASPGFNDAYALKANEDAALLTRLQMAYTKGQKVFIRTDGTECTEGDGSLWGNITMFNTWENFQ